MIRRFAQVVFCVMSGMLILPHVARPQALNGSVVGNIKDPSGAAVPDAAVTLTNTATQISRQAVTDAQGGYDFATVQPGVYSVKVTKVGFAALLQANVPVTADAITRADEVLTVGGVNQTVQVEAEAAVLQTDTSQVSSEMTADQMANMPTYIGRNFQNLLVTVPGVTNVISNSHSVGTNPSRAMQYYVNGGGQSYEQNDTRVDGASIKNMWERDILALVPTLEAVETVNVQHQQLQRPTPGSLAAPAPASRARAAPTPCTARSSKATAATSSRPGRSSCPPARRWGKSYTTSSALPPAAGLSRAKCSGSGAL